MANRGYIRHTRRHVASKQLAKLLAAGVKESAIYRDDEWDACVKSLRHGDKLVVAGLLRALGDSRKEIRAAIDQVRGRGAVVMDAETGRTAGSDDAVGMLNDTLAMIHAEAVMPSSEHAREMARKSAKARKPKRMPRAEAIVHWKNPALSEGEALARMWGWNHSSAYREFKARGMPAGPKSVRMKQTN